MLMKVLQSPILDPRRSAKPMDKASACREHMVAANHIGLRICRSISIATAVNHWLQRVKPVGLKDSESSGLTASNGSQEPKRTAGAA